MIKKKHLMELPSVIFHDNNCTLYEHCERLPGETLHLKIALPVDVFHWKCKHKKTKTSCSVHCNPYMFPELLTADDKWFFNFSRAEQTNVWFGGFRTIIREMGSVKCEFFLDEMILQKNILTKRQLERDGCIPGYNPNLRFARGKGDVSS